jgi:hypothetical protein
MRVSAYGRRATSGRRYLVGGVLTLALLTVAVPMARAQTEPVEGGTPVGGDVSSTLELILTQPSGFSTFKKSGTFSLSFNALAIGTEATTQLSLADGDATSGSRLGHLASGSKRLPDPLQARVGNAAFQPLDESIDPLLTRWTRPVTREPAKITLRQQVKGKPSGTYHKTLLVTLSSETP